MVIRWYLPSDLISVVSKLHNKILYSKLCFSANCSFFGQSFSLGHYPLIQQPPKGVYLLNLCNYIYIYIFFLFLVENEMGVSYTICTRCKKTDICKPNCCIKYLFFAFARFVIVWPNWKHEKKIFISAMKTIFTGTLQHMLSYKFKPNISTDRKLAAIKFWFWF